MEDVLSLFCPPVRQWFATALGEPTPPQRLGWPAIAAGEHTLILSPTGSGKTLAAFLACLDHLWRQPSLGPGVQVLYVSPLKALNNDIERNLRAPLAGVRAAADRLGMPLSSIQVAVRTGDTPQAERQRQARQPPQVLITTPESLHLLLTSNQRAMLRDVRYCIVDEIHVLCPNKRGVFLALLLERLSEGAKRDPVRIGLSATQRPLDEVARYLGGTCRPVRIVDAGQRKALDLQVCSPVERFGWLAERTVWPSIQRRIGEEIRHHRSTLVFANNRRLVERLASQLNELLLEQAPEAAEMAADAEPRLVRPHHGSLSLEVRQQTEQELKEGKLAGVVATASLELGIDMGDVDLVIQVESPGNVARGLQRVGRAGHLVGQTSKGRLIPKTQADLLEQAVLTREMVAGRVEELVVPTNCLDVLAQQIVAMVAVDSWEVPELLRVLRRTWCYRDLTAEALESVLEMLSGRFPAEAFRDLRARISWDRIHNRLHPLPGSRQLALSGGGTIPDTGQYTALISGSELRIGELDEEFVFERRIGDVFQLGVHAWRIERIEPDRVYVSRAEGGAPALMPFWRGESFSRSPDFGRALGGFLREMTTKLAGMAPAELQRQLAEECRLDEAAASNLYFYLKRQVEEAGCLPNDQLILVEGFRDQIGDWHVAILSPLGSRFHLTLRLALEASWRQRYGYLPQCIHADDGLLIKLIDADAPPLGLLEDVDPDALESNVLAELAESALFAIRFRHNAARTLMMPRAQPGKRAPLWLQRLRARSLLQVCRQHPRFPVVLETYRECLQDHLEVERVRQWLVAWRHGRHQVRQRLADTPSPFATGLLFRFTAQNMYVYDKVDSSKADSALDSDLLADLVRPASLDHLVDARAIRQVESRLRGGRPPRTKEEAAEWLRRLGDVRESDLAPASRAFLDELVAEGRVVRLQLANAREPTAWLLAEERPDYAAAFPGDPGLGSEPAASRILRRFLLTRALVGLAEVQERYPFPESWTRKQLEAWATEGTAVRLELGPAAGSVQWSAPANWEELQRTALALGRREVPTVSAERFQEFLLEWQGLVPAKRRCGPEGLRAALTCLAGLPLPVEAWEQAVLPARVGDYQPKWLDELTLGGEWCWALLHPEGEREGLLAFLPRAELPAHAAPNTFDWNAGPEAEVYEQLRTQGAAFSIDLANRLRQPLSRIHQALWRLARAGVVSNDRFDMVRRGEEPAPGEVGKRAGRQRLAEARRVRASRPEGRWSLLPWGTPEAEERALHAAELLLHRYGVASRELARLDPWLPPWRMLYEVFTRLELAGEVRRGFFVEGLSGAQFALPEAVDALMKADAASATCLLVHSQDPANLQLRQGPLQSALVESEAEEASLARRPGNWLVFRGGRPVLFIEQQGRRLVPAVSASADELRLAVAKLGDLLRTGLGLHLRGKVTVDEWQGQPVIGSPGQELLEAAGFVRDYQSLSLYALR